MKIKTLLIGGVAVSVALIPSRSFASPAHYPVIPRAFCAPLSQTPGLDNPDVVLERLDDEGQSEESVGESIFSDDSKQTLASVLAPAQTQIYLIHIKNTGQNDTTFRASLGGLLSATGTETVWAPQGWAGFAALDGQTTDVFPQLKSKTGWETPRVKAGEEALIRLSLTAPAEELPLTSGAFRFVARKDDQSDAVIGQVGPQFIAKIQWTPDEGKNWRDVTDTTMVQILHNEALGVRAIKAVPSAPWGDNFVLGPKWTFQATNVEGEEVWLQPTATALTGATVTATLGNSKSFQARVLPDPYVTLTVDKGYTVLIANATTTSPRLVSVKVEDEDDNPLAQTKVRLRAFNGKTAIASFWTPDGKDKATQGTEQVLLTNEQGEIQVTWTVGADVAPMNGEITLRAEVVDDEGTPFGDDDTFNVSVEGGDGG